ncbi:MAG: chromosome segregation protein SMC, partial [Alphaproteobacteria bacterium]
MVQFTKVRISGFKSFVEPTEFNIEPGMTGIVGPNGCGKSNLLEAMRWSMGETSAKQMRGGGMDDVIFNGTNERPPRNIAEVILSLDNHDHTAPAAFNGFEELEISRRIERESGSTYKVNGKETRARDVQLLFADLSTGARSTAIVSQGRIGAIINAKPQDRRLLLEEAAGITGLHSRRHEAELRLRAAENNLTRLEDVVNALNVQMQGLKRQARQATRYRNLSDHIRRAEAIQLHLRWTAAALDLTQIRHRLGEIETQVNELTSLSAREATELAEGSAQLPGLRHAEAEAAAELQRLVVARETLEAEEARLKSLVLQYETTLAQIAADTAREQAFMADAGAAVERLAAEESSLREAADAEAAALADATAQVTAARAEVERCESEATDLTQKIAADDARRASVQRQIAELDQRLVQLRARAESFAAEQATLRAATENEDRLNRARGQAADAAAGLEAAQAQLEAAEDSRSAAQFEEAEARKALQQSQAELSRLRGEAKALLDLLSAGHDQGFTPVIDLIKATPGYELALGAALGDDLNAPVDGAAPIHWQTAPVGGDAPALPAGAEALSQYVTAPAELTRRLSQIGVVADEAAAHAIKAQLAQGQRLVTRAGAVWRWDGFTVAAGAPTAAAIRLKQKNRLRDVQAELGEIETAHREVEDRLEEKRVLAEDSARAVRSTTEDVRQAFAALNAARDAETRAAQAEAARASRLQALERAIEEAAATIDEADMRLKDARSQEAQLAATDGEKRRLAELREAVAAQREALTELQRAAHKLEADAAQRRQRLSSIEAELHAWRQRTENSTRQIAALDERAGSTRAELDKLAARPDEMAERKAKLNEAIDAAQDKRRRAADALVARETAVAEIDKRLKQAERQLADARELRGRTEGAVSQGELALQTVVERIAERLGVAADQALPLAEIKDGDELPTQDAADARVDRLVRERENMGPVNLRAEQEADELEQQITTYETERADLIGAIEKFRTAIVDLNKEGRERLLKSFEEVNAHFEKLFVLLFGGGRAFLKLVEAEDPLETGLEIMASPPGKKLQTMSLLSGG